MPSAMGRPRYRHHHLPPRMQERRLKDGTVCYYYRHRDGRKEPLGKELNAARVRWGEIENGGGALIFERLGELYQASSAFLNLAPKTQHEYSLQLKTLERAMGKAPVKLITPTRMRQYRNARAHVPHLANRELALVSALWSWAQEQGLPVGPNPCKGVKRYGKKDGVKPRTMYVTHIMYQAVLDAGDALLRDCLRMLYLSGQNPKDVLRWERTDIAENGSILRFRRGKTDTPIEIELTGEFGALIQELLARPRKISGRTLLQTDEGQPVTRAMLRNRFDDARIKAKTAATEKGEAWKDWQLRDLRPKGATDVDDLRHAQQLLGHADEATTAKIYRRVKGNRVKPVR